MFNFFRKAAPEALSSISNTSVTTDPLVSARAVEIPENVFVENEIDTSSKQQDVVPTRSDSNIELLFNFLDKNHESKGYEDALMNPDTKHLEQNIEALRNQLDRTIRRVKTFYEDFIREIDFHINSRSRSGMVDVVDELKMKRSIAESHVQKVIEIENEHRNNTGDSQGMIISYSRGFMNGLSAISHHTILKRF